MGGTKQENYLMYVLNWKIHYVAIGYARIYRVIQSYSTMIKENGGKIICKENVNNFFFFNSSPFPSVDVFTLMSLCTTVIIWKRFRAESSRKYR
jgi:hypothetical protein